jgi:exodeoxyribonuclease VII large subunit
VSESISNKPGTSADAPFAVHQVSSLISDWIGRLGTVWIEGQLSEVNPRRGITYMSLRDTEKDISVQLHAPSSVLATVTPKLEQGSRIIAEVKADWWPKRGSLQFKVFQIRTVGLGELIARLEALRNLLAAEGLFDVERKKPLPFLPNRIGLICGANSDAMHDVITNTKRRWPDIEFVIREVAVQGINAVKQVSLALTELDAIDDVDVIVIARGGGSFEDLLPFSDESLIRLVSKLQTPIVAAIGHEEDRPLIDYVADYRASTPTDAARRIVPDVIQELADLKSARNQLAQLSLNKLKNLIHGLQMTLARPAISQPSELINQRIEVNRQKRDVIYRIIKNKVLLEASELAGQRSTLRALSPQGTLERGFAIVRDPNGRIISSATVARTKESLEIRFADESLTVRPEN